MKINAEDCEINERLVDFVFLFHKSQLIAEEETKHQWQAIEKMM